MKKRLRNTESLPVRKKYYCGPSYIICCVNQQTWDEHILRMSLRDTSDKRGERTADSLQIASFAKMRTKAKVIKTEKLQILKSEKLQSVNVLLRFLNKNIHFLILYFSIPTNSSTLSICLHLFHCVKVYCRYSVKLSITLPVLMLVRLHCLM